MADSTESGVCRGEDVTTAQDLPQTECFIQTLDFYGFDNNSIKDGIPLIQAFLSLLMTGFNEEVKCLNSAINNRNTFLTTTQLPSQEQIFTEVFWTGVRWMYQPNSLHQTMDLST